MQYIFKFALRNYKEMNCTVEQLSAIIAEKEHIALIGHFNPDGDAIGSVMGAFYFLKSIGKNAVPILPGPIPANLRYIDADDELVIYADKPSEARSAISRSDLIISLDFNSLGRTEWLEKIIRESNATKVLIDHHLSPVKEEFDFIISDTEVSSTCELLFYTLLAMPQAGGDPKKLPELSLTALASGMLTDTNNFNNSTGPGTFRMASMILEAGVDLSVLNDLIFKRYSENRIRLMGHLLSERMTIIPELGASCLVMTKEDKALFGYRDGDSEGFVNIPLTIDGVRVSALFTESSDYVRVSLRSKDGISVNRLSRLFFNGGGHEKAAGGRLYMPIGNVKDYFKSSLEQFLHAEGEL